MHPLRVWLKRGQKEGKVKKGSELSMTDKDLQRAPWSFGRSEGAQHSAELCPRLAQMG